jgi:hypothetical protein
MEVLLKSDKNNGYITWKLLSLNFSYYEKCFRQRSYENLTKGVPVSLTEISETKEYDVSPIQIRPYQKQGHVKRLLRENNKIVILNDTVINAESATGTR